MRTRFLTALSLAALAGVATISSPAMAEVRPPGGGAFVDDNDNPTVEAIDTHGGGGASAGGSGGGESCSWEVVIADDFVRQIYDTAGGTRHSATGRWLQKVCDGVGAVAVNGAFLVPEGGVVDVVALALQARTAVEISPPTIRTNPEAGGRLYVRIPTWLWVDGGWWHGYQATASAGRVNATVTARPIRTAWQLGDGTSLTCTGPGVAWQPGTPEASSNCSHTYTSSSAAEVSGNYELNATVVLEVSWTSNVGQSGALDPISRTASRQVEVGEIQAVGTGRTGAGS